MLVAPITVELAAEILGSLWSDQDPVFYGGLETTAQDLAGSALATAPAARVRVVYWTLGNELRAVEGSLKDMILDRLGCPRTGLKRAKMQRKGTKKARKILDKNA